VGADHGYSKTIDSFIETVRRADGRLQYLHQGQWKDADCRNETVRYRATVRGAPAGPPVLSTTTPVCRTVHGPVVSYDEAAGLARSVQYAMYRRELENVNGLLTWNKADNLEEFEAGVRMLTWNENVTYADADGRIAFWHPGLYPVRSSGWDSRFPAPGTGEHDFRGLVPFERMPQSVDPDVGYLANWNNKPAAGWIDEYLDPASSRPGGRAIRVQVVQQLAAAQPRMTPEGLRATEFQLGLLDQRAPEFLPRLQALRSDEPRVAQALELLRGWDGLAYDPAAYVDEARYTDPSVTDTPAYSLFARTMDALRDDLFDELPQSVRVESDAIGSHVWDASVIDNVALRVLDPSTSSLTPSRDYTGGRSADQVLLAAVGRAVSDLVARYGPQPEAWRDQHPRRPVRSLTGVVGPSLTMPYQDRGSYVHVVAFDGPAAAAGLPGPAASAPATAAAPVRRLPATGATSLVWAALLLLAAGLALRRRQRVAD
jgi:penicillin amidase